MWGGALENTQYLHDNLPMDSNEAIRLTLDQDRAYFGFWWSAGGSPDEVRLYDNGVRSSA